MKNKIFSILLLIFAAANFVNAQTTEVKISLDEQFFEALLEAVFTHLNEPSVPLTAKKNSKNDVRFEKARHSRACDESIKLKREIDGVRTAVRFRQGKIYAPIAFKGNYNPPLIGCIEFQGWAETNIELSFNERTNALVGKVKVLTVNMSGTGGVGSSYLARFVQSSIDKKVNPIEVIKLDKLSFTTPVQNSGSLRMRALGIRHEVKSRSLDVYLKYRFEKG